MYFFFEAPVGGVRCRDYYAVVRNTLVMLVEKASFGSLKGVRINLKGYPSLVFVALNHHAFPHTLSREVVVYYHSKWSRR